MASKCPLCRNAEEELDHLLIHCPAVWGIWAALMSITGFQWPCPYLVREVLLEWSYFPIKKRSRKLWLPAPLSLIWAIWKERNRVVFEDVAFSIDRMKHSFASALISWAGLISDVFFS